MIRRYTLTCNDSSTLYYCIGLRQILRDRPEMAEDVEVHSLHQSSAQSAGPRDLPTQDSILQNTAQTIVSSRFYSRGNDI